MKIIPTRTVRTELTLSKALLFLPEKLGLLMFIDAPIRPSVDLAKFDTSDVTDMEAMFT